LPALLTVLRFPFTPLCALNGVLFGRPTLPQPTVVLAGVGVQLFAMLIGVPPESSEFAYAALAASVAFMHKVVTLVRMTCRAMRLAGVLVPAMKRAILAVLSRSAPLEVPRLKVKRVAIKVAYYEAIRPRAVPRLADELVNRTASRLACLAQVNAQVAVTIDGGRQQLRPPTAPAEDAADIGYLVAAFVAQHWPPSLTAIIIHVGLLLSDRPSPGRFAPSPGFFRTLILAGQG
jgi:hypothetical protein